MTEAQRLAATLESDANDHRAIAQSVDGRPEHTANWQHMLTAREAAAELRRLEVENDALQAKLRRSEALCREWAVKAATWMASPEAAQRLDGYRELAQQVNRLEAECEQLRAALVEIKAFVCGSSVPRWDTTDHTYASREAIANRVDAAIAKETK